MVHLRRSSRLQRPWPLGCADQARLPKFSTYSFGIYSSTILDNISPPGSPLTTVFGWNVAINLFYLPGSILGAKASDIFGPKWCLIVGVGLQSIIGFIMAACYPRLSQPGMVGTFAVVFGIFISLGEFGPGNNIGRPFPPVVPPLPSRPTR